MLKSLSKNFGKPSGAFGSVLLSGMNRGHAALTGWALGLVEIGQGSVVLDIGCGGGNAVSLMSAKSNMVYGVDYSEVSVKKTLRKNADAVRQGRVRVEHASVSILPFADDTFDLITAFETVYFWPALAGDFKEVRRVLKPGGLFMPVFQAPRDPAKAEKMERSIHGMKIPDPAHIEALLSDAGFGDVSAHEKPGDAWIDYAVIGRK